MSHQMKFVVLGVEKGRFTDEKTGESIDYGAVHVEETIDAKAGSGSRSNRMSATPAVVDQLKSKKFPAPVICEVAMRQFGKGYSLRIVGVAAAA